MQRQAWTWHVPMYLLASTMYDECMAELMMRHSLFLFFFGRYKHCIFALLTDDALATARCATTPVLSGTQAYIHCMRVASGLVARQLSTVRCDDAAASSCDHVHLSGQDTRSSFGTYYVVGACLVAILIKFCWKIHCCYYFNYQ